MHVNGNHFLQLTQVLKVVSLIRVTTHETFNIDLMLELLQLLGYFLFELTFLLLVLDWVGRISNVVNLG